MSESQTTASAADAPVPTLPVPLGEADARTYAALSAGDGAVWFHHAARHWSRFSGPKAGEVLNGLVTNDVAALSPGGGQYAAALTPKGKMLADVVVLRTDPESFLVGTSARAGEGWWSMVRKYVNPRLAVYRDESAQHMSLGVYGARAAAMLARIGGAHGGAAMLADALEEALLAWPMWRHAAWSVPGTTARLIRVPYLGAIAGFELLVEPGAHVAIADRLKRAGAVAGNDAVYAVASVEAGRPVFGEDMDESTIPQEANLDQLDAVSFSKGCYTGQETVARIHFRGHVNRHLRGLRSNAPIPIGATLTDGAGKAIGTTRRSVISPRLGAIATAMARREVAPGDEVRVTWAGDGSASASVVPLPFDPP